MGSNLKMHLNSKKNLKISTNIILHIYLQGTHNIYIGSNLKMQLNSRKSLKISTNIILHIYLQDTHNMVNKYDLKRKVKFFFHTQQLC